MNLEILNEIELKQLKADILNEIFPTECDLVGENDLTAIINGPVKLKQTTFGANLDFQEAYITVAAAIAFIDSCLSIFVNLQTAKKNVSEGQLKEEVIKTNIHITISDQEKEEIIDIIEERLKRYE